MRRGEGVLNSIVANFHDRQCAHARWAGLRSPPLRRPVRIDARDRIEDVGRTRPLIDDRNANAAMKAPMHLPEH
jgi:hypothetical protein